MFISRFFIASSKAFSMTSYCWSGFKMVGGLGQLLSSRLKAKRKAFLTLPSSRKHVDVTVGTE